MKKLTAHLTAAYHPLAMVVYGSWATGDQRAESDFDALLITEDTEMHDTALVDGIRLDVWVYPRAWAETVTGEDVIQLHDGVICLDTDGLAAELIARARAHAAAYRPLPAAEKRDLEAWCRKMAARIQQGGDDGQLIHLL